MGCWHGNALGLDIVDLLILSLSLRGKEREYGSERKREEFGALVLFREASSFSNSGERIGKEREILPNYTVCITLPPATVKTQQYCVYII